MDIGPALVGQEDLTTGRLSGPQHRKWAEGHRGRDGRIKYDFHVHEYRDTSVLSACAGWPATTARARCLSDRTPLIREPSFVGLTVAVQGAKADRVEAKHYAFYNTTERN